MPAPPARIRSTRTPCGTSSTSSSPASIWSSAGVRGPGRQEKAATSRLDLAGGDEQHRAELADGSEAVGDEGEVLDALLFGGDQQADGEAVTGAKSGDGDGVAFLEIGDGLFGTSDDLISHGVSPQATLACW